MNSIPVAPAPVDTALITSGYWQLVNTLPPHELNKLKKDQFETLKVEVWTVVEKIDTEGNFYERFHFYSSEISFNKSNRRVD